MFLFVLAMLADRPPIQAKATAAPIAKPAAAPVSLYAAVAARMTAAGRVIFQRYIAQTLTPRARADAQAELAYRKAVQQQMTAGTLDLDAVAAIVDRRKQAAADTAAAIRASAFAMIKSLPAQDRRLALTAIFADTRLPKPNPVRAPS
jgi:hypothetical protein